MNKIVWMAIGVLLQMSLLLTATAEAVMVMPVNIEEMTQRAEKIFVGKCTRVERGVNAQGIPMLTVTFAVSESLKGDVGQTVTFQQIDPAPRPPAHPRIRSIWSAISLANVPTYAPGEEALLFLAREGKLGLTAPVGLSQGKLPITAFGTGTKLVTNSALKKTQLSDVSLPEPGKAANYDQVVTTIRALTQPAQ